MSGFDVVRTSSLSAEQAWSLLTDWERHGSFIPFTTVDPREVMSGYELPNGIGAGQVLYATTHRGCVDQVDHCQQREFGVVAEDHQPSVVITPARWWQPKKAVSAEELGNRPVDVDVRRLGALSHQGFGAAEELIHFIAPRLNQRLPLG